MKKIALFSVFLLLLLEYCSPTGKQRGKSFYQQTYRLHFIEGDASNLATPGDRVYVIGYQDGSFPDLGKPSA